MARFEFVSFLVLLLALKVSGASTPQAAIRLGKAESDEAMLRRLSEDVDELMKAMSSTVIRRKKVDEALSELSNSSARLDKEYTALDHGDVVKAAASVNRERKSEQKRGSVKALKNSGVVGPTIGKAEKERRRLMHGIGPKPLKKWLDSFAGEARRIIWSVGPKLVNDNAQ